MLPWIEKARRGGNVSRMHCETVIQPYNNAMHTFNAIIIAKEIAVGMKTEDQFIVDYLLTHDLAEEWVGDIPAPVKKYAHVSEAIETVERAWNKDNLPLHYVEKEVLSEQDYLICKCADYLELCHFCLTEMRMGNLTVRRVYGTGMMYIKEFASKLQSDLVYSMLSNMESEYEENYNAR